VVKYWSRKTLKIRTAHHVEPSGAIYIQIVLAVGYMNMKEIIEIGALAAEFDQVEE
jgi:hypothetical protein